MFSVGPKPSLNANAAPFQPPHPKLPLERPAPPDDSPVYFSIPALARPTALRPGSAGENFSARAHQPEAQRPQTAPGDLGDAPLPHGLPPVTKAPSGWDRFPNYDTRAHYQYDSLRYLENHPDVGVHRMWNDGTVPVFPSAERPPTAAECAALEDFAGQVNGHRKDAVRSGLPPTHLHRLDPLRNGEYGAMYGIDSAGSLFRQEFKFNAGQAVELDSTRDTLMVIHSHPIHPWQGPATLDDLATRMPSVTDHQAAAIDHMKSGADNYLVYGDRVSHFNGKSLEVTELRPSPLEGRLPDVTP